VDVTHVLDMTDRELWLVTAQHGSRRSGLIATFVNSASIVADLPRMLVCLANQHFTRELIEASGTFGLHLLGEERLDWVWRFGTATGREIDKFDGLPTRQGAGSVPLLEGAAAWLACRVEDRWNIGDRTAYIAEVIDAGRNNDGLVLTFQRLLQLAPPERRQQLKLLRERDSAIDAAAILTWRQKH
jgi:flavin reductase (DIM6/NTAB) family NADH-FMN oxidoreductase RutF